ncbi:MAG: muramoyltetrapeptide carboxypeptidase [Myxococcota bacterium]|jgi:muramoyltetrapeptide carboxypeptidase
MMDGPIAVVAPCHPHGVERFEHGLQIARDAGFDLQPIEPLLQPWLHLAAPDPHRLDHLVEALRSPRWSAVWLARGGSGLTRLLSRLPDSLPLDRPVIGFSDATALHAALWRRGHTHLVHGPVVHSLSKTDAASRDHLFRLLRGDAVPALVGDVWRSGSASGPLVGGNLALLAALCGTPWQVDVRGAILVIEEIGEHAYRIDRMLQQLHDAGGLCGVAGVALGEFVGCTGGARWTLDDVLRDQLAPLNVPILARLPIGHGAANHAFPIGASARIEDGTLSWN